MDAECASVVPGRVARTQSVLCHCDALRIRCRRRLIRRFFWIILWCTLTTEAKAIRLETAIPIAYKCMRRREPRKTVECIDAAQQSHNGNVESAISLSQYVTSRGCASCSCSIFTSTWPDRFHYWRFLSHLCAAVKSLQTFNGHTNRCGSIKFAADAFFYLQFDLNDLFHAKWCHGNSMTSVRCAHKWRELRAFFSIGNWKL